YRGGSTATGRSDPDPTDVSLIGVEPTTAACLYHSVEAGEMVDVAGPHHSIMAGLNCGRPSPVAWPTVSYSYDWFTAIDDDVARLGMRELATYGVVSGETGAAATGTILALTANGAAIDASELGLHPDATVVAISTEGATDPAAYERIVGHPPTADRSRDTG
ncbi:MAG: pyridoxal-phosphate dependent enzyme, partial [Acidimicrobiales bacterium]